MTMGGGRARGGGMLGGLLGGLEASIGEELAQDPFQRDPDYIERILPYVERGTAYFRPEVRGLERVPEGPCILVGNHNGGIYTPEAYVMLAAWARTFGTGRAVYALGHNMAFVSPIRTLVRKVGIVPATPANADAVLDRGAPLMIYPGGDHEAFRPWTKRHVIDFGGRRGFVELALRRQVPVVPVVAQGAHQATVVVARGARLARRMGLGRVKVKIFPFVVGLPWGVAPGFFPTVPLPSRITIEVGEPLDWSGWGPGAARDAATVGRLYDEITGIMQGTMDRLARERPFPVFS